MRILKEKKIKRPTVFFLAIFLTGAIYIHYSLQGSPIYPLSERTLKSPITSPFNQKEISVPTNNEEYTFIVAGHLYGTGHIVDGINPPSRNLLNNIELINKSNAILFIGLGDLFLSNEEKHVDSFAENFSSQIKMPFLNAVGNHDLTPNSVSYEKAFGLTYFDFTLNSERFIIINTQLESLLHARIEGLQLDYLRKQLLESSKNETVKNIFILGHKNIWIPIELHTDLAVRTDNAFSFEESVRPILIEVSKNKNIYWLSGDPLYSEVGLAYYKEPKHNITYLNTSMTDRPADSMIKVVVEKNKKVTLIPISLSGKQMQPIAQYSLQRAKRITSGWIR